MEMSCLSSGAIFFSHFFYTMANVINILLGCVWYLQALAVELVCLPSPHPLFPIIFVDSICEEFSFFFFFFFRSFEIC